MNNSLDFTVRDLITILLSYPMEQEVLIDFNSGDLFCMIANSNAESAKPVPTDSSKKREKNYVVSFEQIRKNRQKNYDKYYRSTAFKYSRRKWTAYEDHLIMLYPEDDDLQLSAEMERSVAAIQTRRWILRHKGDLTEDTGMNSKKERSKRRRKSE